MLGASKPLDNWCKWFGKYDEDGHCSPAAGAIIHAHLMDVVVLACGGKENAFVGPLVGITWISLNTPNERCGANAGFVGSFFWPSPFWPLGDFFVFFAKFGFYSPKLP